MRYHLKRKLLKYKNVKSLPRKYPTLTKEELKEYEELEDDFFTPGTFRIDFVRGWKRFAFNAEAREFFIDHFIESWQGGAYREPPIPECFITRDWIGRILDAHMPHLRAQYKKYASPMTDHDIEKETKRKLRKRNAARQHTVCPAALCWMCGLIGSHRPSKSANWSSTCTGRSITWCSLRSSSHLI